MSSAIRVALRICPELDDRESGSGSVQRSITLTNGNTVTLHRQKDGTITDGGSPGVQSSNLVVTHQYTFDKVFPEYTTQEEVFSSVRDLVQESLRGFNVTIFAFGMTGSGKTYTISGEREATGYSSHEVNTGFRPRSQSSGIVTGMGTIAGSNTPSIDPSKAGIVPRTVYHVFSELRREATEHCDSIAMVFLTFVELYNNTFYDLLASDVPTDYNGSSSSGHGGNSGLGGLKLHDHPTRGMQLSGSATLRTPVASAEEALALIQRGYKLRATAATNLNERSSRSHTVLSLEVVISGRQEVSTGVTESGPGASGGNVAKDAGSTASVTRYGKINLVDLAGSERVKQSGAEGQTLEEAKQINKALSVLGDVLNSLSKRETDKDRRRTKHGVSSAGTTLVGGGGSHIPYRNSKLTMLLKDSLGGNAKTMMIATIR